MAEVLGGGGDIAARSNQEHSLQAFRFGTSHLTGMPFTTADGETLAAGGLGHTDRVLSHCRNDVYLCFGTVQTPPRPGVLREPARKSGYRERKGCIRIRVDLMPLWLCKS